MLVGDTSRCCMLLYTGPLKSSILMVVYRFILLCSLLQVLWGYCDQTSMYRLCCFVIYEDNSCC